jgi:hypothetical protein
VRTVTISLSSSRVTTSVISLEVIVDVTGDVSITITTRVRGKTPGGKPSLITS